MLRKHKSIKRKPAALPEYFPAELVLGVVIAMHEQLWLMLFKLIRPTFKLPFRSDHPECAARLSSSSRPSRTWSPGFLKQFQKAGAGGSDTGGQDQAGGRRTRGRRILPGLDRDAEV